MHWVTPSAREPANDTLKQRLREAVDQFLANSGLKEYAGVSVEKRTAAEPTRTDRVRV